MEKEVSCCEEEESQSFPSAARGASFEGVAPSLSSVEGWEACLGEEVLARGVEGNAAFVVAVEQTDAAVGLSQVVRPEGLRRVTGGFPDARLKGHQGDRLEGHPEVQLEGQVVGHPEVRQLEGHLEDRREGLRDVLLDGLEVD